MVTVLHKRVVCKATFPHLGHQLATPNTTFVASSCAARKKSISRNKQGKSASGISTSPEWLHCNLAATCIPYKARMIARPELLD